MKMNKRQRDNLVKIIRNEMQKWYDSQPVFPEKGPIGAYCLWWAYHTVKVLNRAGIRAQIQAGTAYWPILTPAKDDGVSPNQFGYKFEYHEAIFKVAQGKLPEMHVWAAVAEQSDSHNGFIIDVTTKYWPERCLKVIGREWLAPKPPDYLWVNSHQMPKFVNYYPELKAIELAYQIIKMTETK
jgi:hypothetical protein